MNHQTIINHLDDAFDIALSELNYKLYKTNSKYETNYSEVRKLKELYPKLNSIYEGTTIDNLNEKEIEALINVIDCEREIRYIELKKVFVLGIREAYYLFKEMDMIKDEDTK